MDSLLPPTNAALLRSQFGLSQCPVLAVSLVETKETAISACKGQAIIMGSYPEGQERALSVNWCNAAAAEMIGIETYSCETQEIEYKDITRRFLLLLEPDVHSSITASLLDLPRTTGSSPLTCACTDFLGFEAQPCLFLGPIRNASLKSTVEVKPTTGRGAMRFLQCCFVPNDESSALHINSETNGITCDSALPTLLLKYPTTIRLHSAAAISAMRPGPSLRSSAPARLTPAPSQKDKHLLHPFTTPSGDGNSSLDAWCLSGLPICVTVFCPDGHLRYQNAASIQYYGNRLLQSIDKEDVPKWMKMLTHTPMVKGGRTHGDCSLTTKPVQAIQQADNPAAECSSSEHIEKDILSQLFMLDLGKLHNMMDCLLKTGEVWEGAVRGCKCWQWSQDGKGNILG